MVIKMGYPTLSTGEISARSVNWLAVLREIFSLRCAICDCLAQSHGYDNPISLFCSAVSI
jgi:hypothetical protein